MKKLVKKITKEQAGKSETHTASDTIYQSVSKFIHPYNLFRKVIKTTPMQIQTQKVRFTMSL